MWRKIGLEMSCLSAMIIAGVLLSASTEGKFLLSGFRGETTEKKRDLRRKLTAELTAI